MFVVNEIFKLELTWDYLFGIMQKHLKNMGFDKREEMTEEGEFQMFLAKIVFGRKAQCIIEEYREKEIMRILFVDDHVYEKAR